MFRSRDFFDHFTAAVTATWKDFLLQGVILILLGISIALFPQLLVAMISAALIVVGVFFIVIAWKTRKLKRHYYVWRDEFWEPL